MGLPLFDHFGIKLDDWHHPLYPTWYGMNYRCHSFMSYSWFSYGGRGIKVCDRWRFGDRGRTGFQCWLSDMGPKPTPEHSIDRIDSDGNYEPGNCRWATDEEQAKNKRKNPIKTCPAAEKLWLLQVRTASYQNL